MKEPMQQILLFGSVGFVIIIVISALVYDYKVNDSPFYSHHFGKECNCEFCGRMKKRTLQRSLNFDQSQSTLVEP